jgi:hypothetical protein
VDLLVDLQAGLVGQVKVEENNVRRPGTDPLESFGTGAYHLDPVSRRGERLAHLPREQGWVIVDEQQVGHGRLALGWAGLIREADVIGRAADRTIHPKESTRGDDLDLRRAVGILFALGMIGTESVCLASFWTCFG